MSAEFVPPGSVGGRRFLVNGNGHIEINPLDDNRRRWEAESKVVSCGKAKANEGKVYE